MDNEKKDIANFIKTEKEERLLLPDFQRDFVWSKEDEKKLAATLLVKMPINSFLVINGKKNDFRAKKICYSNKSALICSDDDNVECSFLLDGQQRLSTIRSIFSDVYADGDGWKEVFDKLYGDLRYRWFLDLGIEIKDDGPDVFGLKKLSKPKALKKLEPDEVLQYIVYKPVFVKDEKDDNVWWHPAREMKDKNQNIYNVVNKAAEENLIPLYRLCDDNDLNNGDSLADRVIEKIAENRVDLLKEKLKDDGKSEEEFLKELYPDITGENELNKGWNRLSNSWRSNMMVLLRDIPKQEISYMQLESDELERAVVIFENMNKGGTKLSVFDLLVATAAKSNTGMGIKDAITSKCSVDMDVPKEMSCENGLKFSPRNMGLISSDDDISDLLKRSYIDMLGIRDAFNENTIEYDSVMMINSEDTKRKKTLSLGSEKINEYTDDVVDALLKAYAFLQYRCGICTVKEIKYELMVLPIATLFMLKNNDIFHDKVAIDKMEYWYWCSIFSGYYASDQNRRSIDDIKRLYEFVIKKTAGIFENREKDVLDSHRYSDLKTLLGQNQDEFWSEAIKSSILSYILSSKPLDFINNKIYLTAWDVANKKEYFYDNKSRVIKVEAHHLIPLRESQDIATSEKTLKLRRNKKHILNSPLNYTLITDLANKNIGPMPIKVYISAISNYPCEDHMLPVAAINKRQSTKYYENILKGRYELLKKKILNELTGLKVEK